MHVRLVPSQIAIKGYRQMVRHGFLVSIIVGSSPTTLDYKFVPDEIPGVGFKKRTRCVRSRGGK